MASITSANVIGKVLSRIEDPESLLWGDLDGALPELLKVFLESLAVSEVEQRLGAKLYERSEDRRDHRNGYRERVVQSSWCTVRIRVPRLRGQGYVPGFLERSSRALPEVESYVSKCLLCGLSRSEVYRLLESVTGCRPSEEVYRRVQEDLDARCASWRARRIDEDVEYLFLDAAWARDLVGPQAARICILAAKAVDRDGQMQMLGFERAPCENTANWRGFLMRLKERGLKPERLRLVICDEHNGLLSAIREVFGDVNVQLCWAHRMRNVRGAVRRRDRPEVVAGLRAVYQASHRKAALSAFKSWKQTWVMRYPGVVASVQQDLRELLAFFDCPEEHWQYVRTTNPIERAFRELRRQQFGNGAFANRDSCNRAVYRIFLWLNERWKNNNIWHARQRRLARAKAVA